VQNRRAATATTKGGLAKSGHSEERLNAMAEHSVIDISPEILHGTPVFAGTRVPVKALFDYLKGGETLAEFLDDFPTVSKEQAVKALELAGEDLIDAAVAGRISAKEAQSAPGTSRGSHRSGNGVGE
jgi:uncharacterized protein (DUF433 family)